MYKKEFGKRRFENKRQREGIFIIKGYENLISDNSNPQ
jgi:hypothetical protein